MSECIYILHALGLIVVMIRSLSQLYLLKVSLFSIIIQ